MFAGPQFFNILAGNVGKKRKETNLHIFATQWKINIYFFVVVANKPLSLKYVSPLLPFKNVVCN